MENRIKFWPKRFIKILILSTAVIIPLSIVLTGWAGYPLIKTLTLWYSQLTKYNDRNGDQKINTLDVSTVLVGETGQNGVMVVSDFDRYTELTTLLIPLMIEWQNEGRTVELLNINESHLSPGRDAAEKLRNLLVQKYQNQSFRYLFLIDVFRQDEFLGGAHTIPARIFTDNSSVDGLTVWSDFYFSDIFGTFDINQDGEFMLYNDYQPGANDKQIIPGRIMFDEALLSKQLSGYIQADIAFRKNPTISTAAIIKHSSIPFRDGSSISWPTGNINEESETLLYAFEASNLNYDVITAPDKPQVFSAVTQNDIVYFWGHGSIYAQQINEPAQLWVDLPELQNLNNIQKLKYVIFQGCETGALYAYGSQCADKSLCIAQQTIAQSLLLNNSDNSIPALASVANSITASSYPADFSDLYQSATWNNSLAEAVNLKNRTAYSELKFNRARTALAYFGDPTLPFTKNPPVDSAKPVIKFNSSRDTFSVTDNESGIVWLELSWDNEPFLPLYDSFVHEPHLLPSNKVYNENHTLRIKAWDRAGHLIESTQVYTN